MSEVSRRARKPWGEDTLACGASTPLVEAMTLGWHGLPVQQLDVGERVVGRLADGPGAGDVLRVLMGRCHRSPSVSPGRRGTTPSAGHDHVAAMPPPQAIDLNWYTLGDTHRIRRWCTLLAQSPMRS